MAEMKKIIEESFTQYAGAVLQSRALVDVRDCLKPSARQIFYCLYTDKFTYDKPFKKTLKAIGSSSRMYIHGDSSCEGIIMRAGQPFAMRYPLVEVEGSFGNLMSSGSWAAPRYTGSRLSESSNILFNGIKKNTVEDWRDNYDNSEQYPSVLPSIGFYNIVNGTMGIGIGAASSIPSFNLREVNEAIIKLIEKPDSSFDEIVCYPDFPTGATILNKKEVREYLEKGHGGSCKIRSTIEYNPDENCLVVTEIPYMLYTNTICGELEEILNNETCPSIERFNDLTGKTPLIKIYLKKGSNYHKVLQFLYKNTSLESFYSINMTMLKDGRWPMVFGWKGALQEYITHIRACKRREIQFDLNKALARENILNGLLIAAANIDEVVSIIRASDSPSDASIKLIERFKFNEEQTKAILAMKLSSLTKVDSIKLNDELEEIKKKIAEFHYLLNTPSALDAELIKILREVANKFGDERRTKVINLVEKDEEETPQIQEDDVAVMLFDNNMLRVVKCDELNGAKRGKKGANLKPPKNSNLINTLYTTNLGSIAAFTSGGRMYSFSVSDLEYGNDYSVYELIQLQDNEKVLTLIDSNSFSSFKYILFITKQGLIKKSKTSEYNTRAKKGQVAIKLKDDDSIVNVFLSSNEKDRIMIASNSGYSVFYDHSDIAAIGRASQGIKAIKLKTNEYVIAATIVKENISYKGILSITSTGKGKMTKVEDYNETSRAIKGSLVQKLDDEEELAMIYAIPEEQEKVFITANNKAVILLTKEIPIQGKLTSGVRIIDIRGTNAKVEIM